MVNDAIKVSRGKATVRVNPKLYSLEAIYSAAYVFTDRAYVLLDGNPEDSVQVHLKPKDGFIPKLLAEEFLNELINYADYLTRSNRSRKIREMILQRALATNVTLPEPPDDEAYNPTQS